MDGTGKQALIERKWNKGVFWGGSESDKQSNGGQEVSDGSGKTLTGCPNNKFHARVLIFFYIYILAWSENKVHISSFFFIFWTPTACLFLSLKPTCEKLSIALLASASVRRRGVFSSPLLPFTCPLFCPPLCYYYIYILRKK